MGTIGNPRDYLILTNNPLVPACMEGKGLYLMPPYKSIGGLDYSRTSVKIEIDHFFHDEEDGWLAAIHVASDWYCVNALQLANTFLFLNGSLCAKVEALSC